ncbi:unnamed protein product [Linum trigynum]|uniref:Uncharacterized protein n=1 Tax=Linum trigynum TaxID=586398 RepID=A0AAV2DS46_9ROSI
MPTRRRERGNPQGEKGRRKGRHRRWGMYKERLKDECGGFMEMLRNLHLNLPFLEAMAQMPRYAKYLKGFLTKKPKLKGLANVTLGEECSAYLLNRLPKKRSDPGSFTIPLDIRNHHIDNALVDLGANVNVMLTRYDTTPNNGQV